MNNDQRGDVEVTSAQYTRLPANYGREPISPYPMSDPRGSYDSYEGDEDGFDFWGAVRIIFQRKFLILAILIIGTTAATLLTLQQTPLYKATATIEIQRQETRIMESAGVEPVMIADTEYMETQYALLQSRALAERIVESLDLSNDPVYADPEEGREARVREAAEVLSENLRVSPEGRSRVVNVTYVSESAADAARVANALVEGFIEGSLERKYNTTAYARQFLQDRIITAKATLEDTERRLVEYAQQEGILELSNDSGAMSLNADTLVALNAELAMAQSERISSEQRYNEMLSNSATQDFLDSGDLKRLRERKSDLSAEYQEKLGIFKPDYPDMQKLMARIEAVDAEIEVEKQAIRSAAEATYRAALAREASLVERVNELKGEVQTQRSRRINYTILQREVDTARTQYEALLQRMKEVSIAGGVGSSQVSIVDRAIPPVLPFEPNLPRTVLQGFILSFAFGIGLAFALNYIDDTIKSPEDVKTKLGVPAIGVIPKVKGAQKSIVDALDDPRSPVTEAFFAARTALSFTSSSGIPRSIVVTSTRPAEGKTSSTVSLAVSFAKSGRRVLIIDSDLRKPSFAADPNASMGLSGLLTSQAALIEHVIPSQTEDLFLLPSGTIPPNPAELLTGPRLEQILQEAGQHFDLVLVDTPPILGFTDAPILGSICEATLIVIESGSIRRPAALRTLERLMESQSNVVGVILTKFDARKSGYENGYYYYSYGKGAYEYGSKSGRRKVQDKRKIRLFAEPPTQEEQGRTDEIA